VNYGNQGKVGYGDKVVKSSDSEGDNPYLTKGGYPGDESPYTQDSTNYLNQGYNEGKSGYGQTTSKAPKIDKGQVEKLSSSVKKQFPDVLRADPIIAKLMDKKAVILKEITGLREKNALGPDQVAAFVLQLEKIDAALDKAQANLNRQGVMPKALGSEYKDEEKILGWRTADNPKPLRDKGESKEDFQKRLDHWQEVEEFNEEDKLSDRVTTKHFNEQERGEARLNVGELGQVLDSSGSTLSKYDGEKKTEFVMDREGEIYQFDGSKAEVKDGKKKTTHHSSVLSGGEVAGAGSIVTDTQGKITEVSNLSGHYKPGRAQMVQTLEILLKKGALLDKEWVDAQGKPLEGKALQVYEGAMKLQQKLMDKLEDDPGTDLKSDLALVDSAKKMLGKLGCGPSNKLNKAMVAFLETNERMTGLQIKKAVDEVTKNAVELEDFLRTGGDRAMGGRQADVRDELLEKTKAQRETLDMDAQVRSDAMAPSQGPGKEELKAMRDQLNERSDALEDDDEGSGGPMPLEEALSMSSMPQGFGQVTVTESGEGNYSASAESMARTKGVTLDALWAELRDQRRQQKANAEPPAGFEALMVDDPEKSSYTISVSSLAQRMKLDPKEVWRKFSD
jgi:hypothetical protein